MINVLFFAHLQEIVGNERLQLDIAPITVSRLKQYLQTEFNFGQIEQVMFAVNEEYATDDDVINPGDTVALIPPVSGG